MLAFGYFASAVVSALVASAGLMAYETLVRGGESRAGLSVPERFTHATQLGLLTMAIILVFSVPVAWLPLSLTLAIVRHVRLGRFVACVVSGLVTGAILAIWVLAIGDWIIPSSGEEPIPFWMALAPLLPIAMIAGAIGGVVLWMLCFRAPRVV